MRRPFLLAATVALPIAMSLAIESANETAGEWRSYAGTNAGAKYAALDQINKDTVKGLRIAWRQSSMPLEVRRGRGTVAVPTNYQVTPLMVGGLFYMTAGMLGRRLGEAAQNPSAPFTSAGSQYVPNRANQISLMTVSAQAKQGQLPASLDALLLEVERVKRHGFTGSELERMQRDIARSVEHRVASQETTEPRAISSTLAESFVSGSVVTSPEFDRDFLLRHACRDQVEHLPLTGRQVPEPFAVEPLVHRHRVTGAPGHP